MKLSNLIPLVGTVLGAISPELRAEIKAGIDKMDAKAKTTKNVFDDIAVSLLRIAFNV